MDQHYDRRLVTAPDWMENFACLAGDCPEVCCQQWNVDVDPGHAESLRHIEDPELQELMNRVLRSVHIRRPGSRHVDTIHRLQLLSQPDHHCPLLNQRGECRLQKKYGPYVLCDTCYFHPRTFWQIDEQTFLSACLSCPECARLALAHEKPTRFVQFEAEIDPEAEWLETELIRDPDTRDLMAHRDPLITSLIEILQDRSLPIPQRILNVMDRLKDPSGRPFSVPEPINGAEWMAEFAAIFDPVSETLEKPAQAASGFMRELVGRIPVRTVYKPLTEDALVNIMLHAKTSAYREYQQRFQRINAVLRCDRAALREIARIATERGTGARGLRNVFSELLTATWYELAGDNRVFHVLLRGCDITAGRPPRMHDKTEAARRKEAREYEQWAKTKFLQQRTQLNSTKKNA